MKIYVAGPYSAPTAREVQANVNEAIRIGCALMRKGHSVYIPHLMHYVWLHPDGDFSYEHWTEQDMIWLDDCDALFFIAPSPGANKERERKKKTEGIIYTKLEEAPDEA
jgi:hypothetical protein